MVHISCARNEEAIRSFVHSYIPFIHLCAVVHCTYYHCALCYVDPTPTECECLFLSFLSFSISFIIFITINLTICFIQVFRSVYRIKLFYTHSNHSNKSTHKHYTIRSYLCVFIAWVLPLLFGSSIHLCVFFSSVFFPVFSSLFSY